jgi:glycosyltransferase involved in cell wall biosynthesis
MPDQSRPPTVVFWSRDLDAPSFRHRLRPTIPLLEQAGVRCIVEEVAGSRYFWRIARRRHQLTACDLLVLAKFRLALGEDHLIRQWARRIVFDFDDAIYFRRPRAPGRPADRSAVRRLKFVRTCRAADLVIACNQTLAEAAAPGARQLEIVPTPVDASPYDGANRSSLSGRVLVWIGMKENVAYLDIIRPVLARLSHEYPDLRLRVISSQFPSWDDVPVERVPWSEATEAQQIGTADIGLMPLTDDVWERGKCAFKLLQYMAAGLPSVASDVGTNRSVVQHGVNGFLAESPEQWYDCLKRLLDDDEMRRQVGEEARAMVLERYDRRVVIPQTVELMLPFIRRTIRERETHEP